MFTFNFTADQVAAILHGNPQPQDWYDALAANLPEFDIATQIRVAMFMAQTAHESANYTRLHENLNYRATSLIAQWPKHFNYDNASQYEHKQEAIANRAYCNRMGNGDEASGDGWKYRGRGIMQLTGKESYAGCSHAVYGDDRLLDTPELVEQDMDVAVKSACWLWNAKRLNPLADASDIKEVTHRINGGFIGLLERQEKFDQCLVILQ